jgi:hypothetical protein
MPRIGVKARQAGDLTGDAGFLQCLADRRLGQRLAQVDGAARRAQFPLSDRRTSSTSPPSLTTATFTDGTMLFARGPSGSS